MELVGLALALGKAEHSQSDAEHGAIGPTQAMGGGVITALKPQKERGLDRVG